MYRFFLFYPTSTFFLRIACVTLFGLVIVTTTTLFGQNSNNSLQELKLKGKVKSIVETHHVIPKGASEIIRPIATYQFNEDGNLTEKWDASTQEKTTWQFDQFGKQISSECHGKDGKLLFSSKMKYNEQGKPSTADVFNSFMPDTMQNWCLTFYYNEDGNCTELVSRNDAGYHLTRYEYKYDSLDRQIEKIRFQNGDTMHILSYVYNNKGQLIEEWQRDPAPGKIYRNVFVFNDQGNIIEEGRRHNDENYIKLYAWELDQNGNWTKRVPNQGMSSITFEKRVIEYY